jgi:hypothetical protein
MKSDDITVQQLFQDRRQFMVPFYQRAYVWTLRDQWEQLWEDVRTKAEARLFGNGTTPHFLGAVVFDPQPRVGLMGVDTLHIIDGQQRLTTFQLMLKSLLLAIEPYGCRGITEIVTGAIRNGNPDTMQDPAVERYKVWPTFRDRRYYTTAIDAKDRDSLREAFPQSFTQRQSLRKIGVRHPAALEAIWFFSDVFARWIAQSEDSQRPMRAEILATSVLQDLKVVSIVLGQADDAQVIFETLNARGAQLTATDLIRNFIFMRADREKSQSGELYERHWAQFEDAYWNSELRRGRMRKPRVEWFVHATLEAEVQDEIDLGRLYHEYRRYVFSESPPRTAECQLAILTKYASRYRSLVDGSTDVPIGAFGRRISPFDLTTVYPLALLIAVSGLPGDQQSQMFTYLVSYVVRRAICGLTSKNYNNVFRSALRGLSRTEPSPATLREYLTSLKGEASRWPTDAEFRNVCAGAPLYPGVLDANSARAVLSALETELRRQARVEDRFEADASVLDVDHVMPQSWFEHRLSGHELTAREEAVLARQNSIRTLGNLTLLNLSVNRGAQNKSYSVKRDLLIANTNLRLNVPLVARSDWSEESIRERGETLAEVALKIWPSPAATS